MRTFFFSKKIILRKCSSEKISKYISLSVKYLVLVHGETLTLGFTLYLPPHIKLSCLDVKIFDLGFFFLIWLIMHSIFAVLTVENDLGRFIFVVN